MIFKSKRSENERERGEEIERERESERGGRERDRILSLNEYVNHPQLKSILLMND